MVTFYGSELLGILPNTLDSVYKTEAQRENAVLLCEMFSRYSNIAVSRLKWSGLPKTVSERFLAQTLYLFGNAVFFQDPNLGYLAMPCTMAGGFNMYYDPVSVNAYSFNYSRYLEPGEFVYMRADPSGTPMAFTVFTWCKRMADIIRTIDVRAEKMKHPFFLRCSEKQRQTYLNLVKKIKDNELLILSSKDFEMGRDEVSLLLTNVDTDLSPLWDTYLQYEQTLYTAMGIENIGERKRERMLVDEVNANNMLTDMSIEVQLKELQHACEQINERYGLDVWVEAKTIDNYEPDMELPEGGDEE